MGSQFNGVRGQRARNLAFITREKAFREAESETLKRRVLKGSKKGGNQNRSVKGT